MGRYSTLIQLTSPYMRGQRVKDAQWLLGHNRFKARYFTGTVDGVWGPASARAANRARWFLGYPAKECNTNAFGQQLYDYLRTDGKHKALPLTYRIRRKARLAQAAHNNSIKAKALSLALTQVGVNEYPYGSNNVKYGAWYGLNYQPWCAMFVTWCFVQSGDRRTFLRGIRSAWAYWPLNAARANTYGLSVTTNPEPGDIVVYYYKSGHIGIFRRWIDRSAGIFEAVEGNTSVSSDDNGGAVMVRRRQVGSYINPKFVRYR